MHEDFTEKDSMALGEKDLPKLRAYEPLQLFFLLRLTRLLRLREKTRANAKPRDEAAARRLRMLSKALYSTYQDCVRLGLKEDVYTVFSRIGAGNSTR